MQSILRKKLLLLTPGIICLVLMFGFFYTASAASNSGCNGFYALFNFKDYSGQTHNTVEGLPQFCTATDLITKLINLGLGFAAIVTVVFLIIGGFWYLTSAGSEELAEKGRKTLVNSIIGLVIIIMAFAIVRIVGNLLQGNSSGGAPSTTQNPGGTTQPPANPPANGGSGESGGSITNSGDPSVAADNNYILVLSIPESKMSCGANSVNIYATVTQADGNKHPDNLGPTNFYKDGSNYIAQIKTYTPAEYGYIITQGDTSKALPINVFICGVQAYQTNIAITAGSANPVSPRGDTSPTSDPKQQAADNSSFSLSLINNKKSIQVNINANSSDKLIMCNEGSQSKLINHPINVYVDGSLAGTGTAADASETIDFGSTITSSKSVSVKICGYTIGGGAKTINP